MDDSLQCGNCGIWVHCFLRNCPECGAPVFLALDRANAKPEHFFDLMTSLYNLVADKENPGRARYLPGISERVIQRRCEIEFQDEAHVFGFGHHDDEDWPEEIRDIFAMALTNTLIGYIYRYIEEFICRTKDGKCGELTEVERESLVSVLMSDESGYNESCFRVLNSENEIDWRVLFCLALRINKNYVRYLLAEEDQEDEWFSSILEQSIEKTTYYYGMAFRALWPDKDLRQFLARRHNIIRKNVEKDFLFGYVVRLSESLHPLRPRLPSHLH
jgi:hypothetical protein